MAQKKRTNTRTQRMKAPAVPAQPATFEAHHEAVVNAGHTDAHGHGQEHGHEALKNERTYFLFWVYLMTDLLMFAGLFAAFAALRDSTFGGATEKEIYSIPLV